MAVKEYVSARILAAAPQTASLMNWIRDNVIPLAILSTAVLVMVVDGKRKNRASAMERGTILIVGLVMASLAFANDHGLGLGDWIRSTIGVG